MKKSTYLLSIATVLIMWSCGPTPPADEEIRSRIKGVYCSEDGSYRLEIKDSTYFNRKVEMGPLGKGPQRESCIGPYELKLEEDKWVLTFGKDARARTLFKDCGMEVVIWNKEEGFVYGDEETTTMVDLIDGTTLTKGPCEY